MRRWLLPVATLLGLAVVWEAGVRLLGVPSYLLPPPTEVWDAAVENRGDLLQHSIVTIAETLAGFGLSILVGIPLAVAIVYSRTMEHILYPLLVGSQAVPKIAIAPLLLVWFGYGAMSKVLIGFLIAFFPVVVSAVTGLASVERDMLQMARVMGTSTWDIFRKIRFPYAMPTIFSGLKVAIALALVGAVIAEFVGSNSGLGYFLMRSTGNFRIPLVFASVVLLTLIGVVLFYAVAVVERLVTPWSVSTDARELEQGFEASW